MVIKREMKNGLYELSGGYLEERLAARMLVENDRTVLWHRHLGYMSYRGFLEMDKQQLLYGDRIGNLEFCDHCMLGKQH